MVIAGKTRREIDVFEEDLVDPLFSEEDILLAGAASSPPTSTGDACTSSGSVVLAQLRPGGD